MIVKWSFLDFFGYAFSSCSLHCYDSLLAISKFPGRRQLVVDKVKRTADALGRELEEAMQKDLVETKESLENFVKLVGKPYQDLAQHRLKSLLATQEKLTSMESTIKTLQIEIQNLRIS